MRSLALGLFQLYVNNNQTQLKLELCKSTAPKTDSNPDFDDETGRAALPT